MDTDMKKLLLKAIIAAANAHAVGDPSSDFLAGYTGSHAAAFDVLSADVSYNDATNEFTFRTSTAGAIAGVAGAAYVFGLDVGGATNAPFTSVGLPGAIFNSTVTLRSDGTGSIGANAVCPWRHDPQHGQHQHQPGAGQGDYRT
jgi:hypothetical protein